MKFSLTGTMNLSWSEVVEAATLAEELGFDAFYTSDHLHAVAGFDPERGNLDALSLVIALAPLTHRIRLGCLVSPISTRHPVPLVRALQTVDVITGGRADVGVGAGWSADEHHVFGLPFPAVGERLAMLDDACAMIVALWESAAPLERDGRYPLHGAALGPRPVQRRAPLLVAGASDRTLAIAARHARAWNATGSPGLLAERVAALRRAEEQAGRAGEVETTVMVYAFVSEDPDAVAERAAAVAARRPAGRAAQARQHLPDEDPASSAYFGPPEGFAEFLARYADGGVDRAILTVPRPWDPDGLRGLAAAAGVPARAGVDQTRPA